MLLEILILHPIWCCVVKLKQLVTLVHRYFLLFSVCLFLCVCVCVNVASLAKQVQPLPDWGFNFSHSRGHHPLLFSVVPGCIGIVAREPHDGQSESSGHLS